MNQELLFVLFIAMIVGIAIAVLVFVDQTITIVSSRSKAVAEVALEHGFNYSARPSNDLLGLVARFALFHRANERRILNVLDGTLYGIPFTCFEYVFIPESRRRSEGRDRIVLLFNTGDFELPRFELRHKSFSEHMARVTGKLPDAF